MATDARTARPTTAPPPHRMPPPSAAQADAIDPERCIDEMLALAEWLRDRRAASGEGRR